MAAVRRVFKIMTHIGLSCFFLYLLWAWHSPINRIRHTRGPDISKSDQFKSPWKHYTYTDIHHLTLENILFQKKVEDFSSKSKDAIQRDIFLATTWETEEDESTNQTEACVDVLCTQYLSVREKHNFNLCRIRTSKKLTNKQAKIAKNTLNRMANFYNVSVRDDPLTSGSCHFINGTERGVSGLVSFPGSGNTWVRELLQTVTRVCTGSVYCDSVLRSSGFDGEGVQSSSVLVVKQHAPTPQWTTIRNKPEYNRKMNRTHFDKVILLIRNPFHALVSEWNRELSSKYGLRGNSNSSHTDSFGQEFFGTNKNWNDFVTDRIHKWEKGFDWIIGCPDDRDVLLVRYEDLKQRVTIEMKRMLDFLLFHLSENEISTRLKKGQFSFHRKSSRDFDPFVQAQEQLVISVIQSVTRNLKHSLNNTHSIEKYIPTLKLI